jgi:hypothetical protein
LRIYLLAQLVGKPDKLPGSVIAAFIFVTFVNLLCHLDTAFDIEIDKMSFPLSRHAQFPLFQHLLSSFMINFTVYNHFSFI